MEKKIFLALILFFSTFYSFGQSTKNVQRMAEGIKTNNLELINKALSKGVTLKEGLQESIKQNNINYVKFFVEKGAVITNELDSAVINNNLEIVEYLLNKGAIFYECDKEVIDGQVYLVNRNNPSDLVPISIVTKNGENRWLANNPKDIEYLSNQVDKGIGYFVKYKTKIIKSGNLSLFYAIQNNNLEMIKLLLQQGLNPKNTYVVEKCHDFRDRWGLYRTIIKNGGRIEGIAFVSGDGYICSMETPTPAILKTPLDFAKQRNASSEIIDLLNK